MTDDLRQPELRANPIRGWNVTRLADIPEEPREIQARYGVWHFNRKNLALELYGKANGYPKSNPYCIDLEHIYTSAQMLDWIFQISNKTWGTARVMKDLLVAFEHIFRPQKSICSCAMASPAFSEGKRL